MITWKAHVEQQLVEIKNSLSSIQATKQEAAFSPPPSDRWEDWLENTNLDNIQGNEFATFFEGTDLITAQNPYSNLPPQTVAGNSSSEDPFCARELEVVKEKMAKMKR